MRRFMANGIWLSIGLDIIMTVITCVFCRQFLIWLNTPADILDYAVDYFILICAGLTSVSVTGVLTISKSSISVS